MQFGVNEPWADKIINTWGRKLTAMWYNYYRTLGLDKPQYCLISVSTVDALCTTAMTEVLAIEPQFAVVYTKESPETTSVKQNNEIIASNKIVVDPKQMSVREKINLNLTIDPNADDPEPSEPSTSQPTTAVTSRATTEAGSISGDDPDVYQTDEDSIFNVVTQWSSDRMKAFITRMNKEAVKTTVMTKEEINASALFGFQEIMTQLN